MITIRALLNQICWDSEFGRGEFVIGYYDRIERRVIQVPLSEVRFHPEDHSFFQLHNAAGQPLSVPLHRVCEVYRNGELIWRRKKMFSSQKHEPADGGL